MPVPLWSHQSQAATLLGAIMVPQSTADPRGFRAPRVPTCANNSCHPALSLCLLPHCPQSSPPKGVKTVLVVEAALHLVLPSSVQPRCPWLSPCPLPCGVRTMLVVEADLHLVLPHLLSPV